jgi:hypothetical protein
MDDLSHDVRDHRGRLIRLAVAIVIGAVVTIVAMRWIHSVSAPVNSDPVATSSVGLLAIAIFVVTTAFAAAMIARFRRR